MARKATPRPRGRPTRYRPELGDEICRRIAEGASLRTICAETEMPDMSTVLRWVREDRESFRKHYAEATEARAHALVEEIITLADSADPDNVQVQRLRVDTRKWFAGKVLPKLYGDRLQADLQHLDRYGNPADPAAINAAVLAFEKLSDDELDVLIALYRKMGVRAPWEPPAAPDNE